MIDPMVEFDRLALLDPAPLRESQQRLVALGWLRAEVNNGGFDQYFFNSAGNLVLVAGEAAVAGGSPELASLVERALALLGLDDPTDRDVRQNRLLALPAETFDALDHEFYDLEASVDLDDVMRRFCSSRGFLTRRRRES